MKNLILRIHGLGCFEPKYGAVEDDLLFLLYQNTENVMLVGVDVGLVTVSPRGSKVGDPRFTLRPPMKLSPHFHSSTISGPVGSRWTLFPFSRCAKRLTSFV